MSTNSFAQEPSEKWELIWQEEFNYEGEPDPEKWSFAPRQSADWA